MVCSHVSISDRSRIVNHLFVSKPAHTKTSPRVRVLSIWFVLYAKVKSLAWLVILVVMFKQFSGGRSLLCCGLRVGLAMLTAAYGLGGFPASDNLGGGTGFS